MLSRLRSRAFTLIELIVVIVIVGVLVAALAFAYVRFANGARDEATKTQVVQIARAAAGIAATSGQVAYPTDPATLEQLFTDASSETTLVAAAPGLSAAGVTVTSGTSTGYGVLSVAASVDGATAGLAMKSPTGNCAAAWLSAAKVTATMWTATATCSGTAVTGASPGDAGGSGGGSGGGSTLAAPTAVTATTAGVPCAAGDSQVSVSFPDVTGATGYQLYVDGTATGARFTTRPHTATLTGAGTRVVQVASVDAGGAESALSAPVNARVGANTTFAASHPFTTPSANGAWLSSDVNVACGDQARETGEPRPAAQEVNRTHWWTFTPTESATYTFQIVPPSASSAQWTAIGYAPIIFNVYTGDTLTGLANVLTGGPNGGEAHSTSSSVDSRPQAHLVAGTAYRIQAGLRTQDVASTGHYRIRVTRGPLEDSFEYGAVMAAPATVGQTTLTGDVDTTFSGRQPGEPGTMIRTSWWLFTPTATGTYRFQRAVPASGSPVPNYIYGEIAVHRGTAITGLTTLGAAEVGEQSWIAWTSPTLTAGTTYRIQWGMHAGDAGYNGRYRISVTRAS